MKTEIAALFAGFFLAALAGPRVIPIMKRLKFGQQEREEGPKSHLQKKGTPTMGGVIFLLPFTLVMIFLKDTSPFVLPVLFLTDGLGLAGFADDYLKVVKKNTDGLSPKKKLALQLMVSAVFAVWMRSLGNTAVLVPFINVSIDLGLLYIPFAVFVILGTDNGVNFTDGLDGLCSTVTIIVAFFFFAASVKTGKGPGAASCAMAGSLMGFLLYNAFPAGIFMGDTGSLALGGFVCGLAFAMQLPLFIPLFGVIYLCEILSVMLQVSYFKLTHGRRIFKMSPLHHHFELCGWSETRVVTVFAAVTVLACALCLASL